LEDAVWAIAVTSGIPVNAATQQPPIKNLRIGLLSPKDSETPITFANCFFEFLFLS